MFLLPWVVTNNSFQRCCQAVAVATCVFVVAPLTRHYSSIITITPFLAIYSSCFFPCIHLHPFAKCCSYIIFFPHSSAINVTPTPPTITHALPVFAAPVTTATYALTTFTHSPTLFPPGLPLSRPQMLSYFLVIQPPFPCPHLGVGKQAACRQRSTIKR